MEKKLDLEKILSEKVYINKSIYKFVASNKNILYLKDIDKNLNNLDNFNIYIDTENLLRKTFESNYECKIFNNFVKEQEILSMKEFPFKLINLFFYKQMIFFDYVIKNNFIDNLLYVDSDDCSEFEFNSTFGGFSETFIELLSISLPKNKDYLYFYDTFTTSSNFNIHFRISEPFLLKGDHNRYSFFRYIILNNDSDIYLVSSHKNSTFKDFFEYVDYLYKNCELTFYDIDSLGNFEKIFSFNICRLKDNYKKIMDEFNKRKDTAHLQISEPYI